MAQKDDENQPIAEISRQAAVWWVLLKDQQWVSLQQGWQFVLWLMRSRRHVREFIQIYRQDERLARAFRIQPDKSSQSNVTHVYWWRGSPLKPAETREQHRRHIAGWGLAATLLITVPTFYFLAAWDAAAPDGAIATLAGEAKERQLADGSKVRLESNSTLKVEFTGQRRDVRLFQGEATFAVATNATRPFVVKTPPVDIVAEADATFAVRINSHVEVEVYEGLVKVLQRGAKAGVLGATVKKGETYRVPVQGFRAIVANGEIVKVGIVDG
ncbi:MAG: FecR domain-containing protein [Steroidobacteraceae bacterium]